MSKNYPDSIKMADVARFCGLSKATISRAVNHPDKLRPDTRKRIEDAFRHLGYRYNPLAASMTKSSAKLLGVMAGSLRESLYLQSIADIQNAAVRLGLNVMFSISNFDPVREAEILKSFQSYKTAGVIVLGASLSCAQHVMDQLVGRIPHLMLWEHYELPGLNCIGSDAGRQLDEAVAHLAGMGHRSIALVLMQDLTVHRATKRYGAFVQALERHGLPFDPGLVHFLRAYQRDPSAMEAGRAAMAFFLSRADRPSAIIFPTGALAMGALIELKKNGLSCPEDLSILSLGDDEAARHFVPAISAMESPMRAVSEMTEEFVAALPEGAERFHPVRRLLECRVIARDSCAPPRARRA